MQNQLMNSIKIFGLAVAMVFVVSVAPVAAHAADFGDTGWTTTGYTDYTPSYSSYDSGDNTGWSTTGYTDYTPADTSNNSNTGWTTTGYTDYTTPSYDSGNTGWTTTGYTDYTTPSYDTGNTGWTTTGYTDYTTPTYYTPSYDTPTYGCTGNCGGGHYTPPPTYPKPTCAISTNYGSINAGDTVTIGWSSTNASSGNISNLGSNLPTSGSRQIVLNNTTTFSGSFSGQGGTASCSATVVVTPKAPTCYISGPDTATAGQSITLNWGSTNSTRGDISNLGTNLPVSGSHSVVIGNTTTYTGTFYGANGQTGNCSKTVTVTVPQQNYPSCSITINNYGNNYNNGYWNANSAVTLSWTSANASSGSINNGFGNVNLNGSRTVYPTQTTTYTGTFYGYNGQSVTCSATVYVGGYVPPQNPNTPFVTLSAVPYTGLDLGPVGTVLYWGFIAFWCALAAYLIVIKRVQNNVYASLKGILFGNGASHAAQTTHVSHVAYAAPADVDTTDSFIVSQINRAR